MPQQQMPQQQMPQQQMPQQQMPQQQMPDQQMPGQQMITPQQQMFAQQQMFGQQQMPGQQMITPQQQMHSNIEYPNNDYLYDKITMTGTIKTYVCAFTINRELETHFLKYIVQLSNFATLPFFLFEESMYSNQQMLQQQQMPQQQQMLQQQQMPQQQIITPPVQQQMPQNNVNFQVGGDGDDNYLETIFSTKLTEFVKTMYQNDNIITSYSGYIPNISEPNSIFAFIKIENPTELKPEYLETVPNEMIFLSRVQNYGIDKPIMDLFNNNKWLYVDQPLCSPYSGYMCKLENNQFVNATTEETIENILIEFNEMGNHFYFSFLPLDTSKTFQRFALFPMNYDCIMTPENVIYYKENKMLFDNTNSFYVNKGIFVENSAFFIMKSPSQFTKI